MWKKFQGHAREKERQIGNPVLIETTYDEKALGRIPNISDLNNANAHRNAQHPYNEYPSSDVPTQLPPLPFNSLAPQSSSRNNRTSDVPTASSVYSQPSPGMNYDWPENTIAAPLPKYADVSPPDTPEMSPERRPRGLPTSRDVSPVGNISEGLTHARVEDRPGSHIPVLLKPPHARSLGKEPVPKTGRGRTTPSGSTRWDDFSGEPTTDYLGKPAQVVPGSYSSAPYAGSRPQEQSLGYQVSVAGGHQKSKKGIFSERATRFTSKGLSVETKPREEWKGASGRMAIVQPLSDNPTRQPLTIPPRSHRKPNPGASDESSRDTPSSAAVTVRRLPMVADTSSVSPDRDGKNLHDDPIKPTVPLKAGRNSPPRSIASPTSPNHQKYPYLRPISPGVQNRTPTNTSQGATQYHSVGKSSSNPLQSKIHRKSVDSTHTPAFNKDDKVPLSRFSWTTYATNTTYQHSPPPSPPPPMPTASIAVSTPTPAASVLNRRRPVPSVASTISTPTARKPVPTSQPTPTTPGPSPSPNARFSMSMGKALPRPPPELESVDHVAVLEAQLDDLRLRRRNVGRLLSDLNATQPQNPLVTDIKKMREAEKKRSEFEDELSEIKAEEHDVGLRLHRAWKRREREDPAAAGSTLWIRRVTS
ncbi:hypothetical protein K432DRAFT_399545 [Lepidopterella palustris CBS 459.81]|uniref:Uncharacterized protein n=1 Tax=Lepidopterella palustris CBS 459.81 TaxID=1314670 RepID=A0A8E2JKY3_9PEZI|nr:hypothetical protein K432DRAFT_399545 [Lepidopterella palustris CBS 459.81]